MLHKNWLVLFFVGGVASSLLACKSNPNKAEKIDTAMEISNRVSGSEHVGVQKGEMVVQDKVAMSERLRDLQNTVYGLEDRAYGTRRLESLGLYGELKTCRRQLASKAYGGAGTLTWTEPLDRVTDKENEIKVGLDEKKDLVGVNREYLLDRMHRFEGYKQILQKRVDEFSDRIEECHAELGNHEFDQRQSSKVVVKEASKMTADRDAIHHYLCNYAHAGASLQSLMVNAMARGWLALSDFKLDQNILATTTKDSRGSSLANVLLFNGWKLAYDHGPVTVADLLGGESNKDARLQAWTFAPKGEVPNAVQCLGNGEGAWNP